MAVTLHNQCPVTVEEALSYLQDQGNPTDQNDLLKLHMNAVAALMLQITGRPRLVWVDGDEIQEWKDITEGTAMFVTNAAPIRKVVSVETYPHEVNSGDTYAGPTEPATYTDDFYFDPRRGYVIRKGGNWPAGLSMVKITYEAGYFPPNSTHAESPPAQGDAEYLALKQIALDALATKWARYKNQKHGVSAETRQEQSITYTTSDFSKHALADLRRYRRSLFV